MYLIYQKKKTTTTKTPSYLKYQQNYYKVSVYAKSDLPSLSIHQIMTHQYGELQMFHIYEQIPSFYLVYIWTHTELALL